MHAVCRFNKVVGMKDTGNIEGFKVRGCLASSALANCVVPLPPCLNGRTPDNQYLGYQKFNCTKSVLSYCRVNDKKQILLSGISTGANQQYV